MKKAARILLTIGAIFNLLVTIGVAIAGVVMAIIALAAGSLFPELYSDLATMIQETWPEVDPDALMWIVRGIQALIILVTSFAGFVLYLVATIIAFNGAKGKKKGIFIANIVFSIFCENLLIFVGGILGVVGVSIEERKAEQAKEEAAKPVEVKKEEPKQVEAKKEEPKPVEEAPKEEAK